MVKLSEYYQRINCFKFYTNGQEKRLIKPIQMIMIAISEQETELITSFKFSEGDMLVIDFHLDVYPFEKIMCKINKVDKSGEMYKLRTEFMGISEVSYRAIRKYLGKTKK